MAPLSTLPSNTFFEVTLLTVHQLLRYNIIQTLLTKYCPRYHYSQITSLPAPGTKTASDEDMANDNLFIIKYYFRKWKLMPNPTKTELAN